MEPLDDPRGWSGFHKHMHPYYVPPPCRCERCNELAELEWREAYWCRECFKNRIPDIGYCTKCEKKIDRSDDWEKIEGNLICGHCFEEGEE